MSFFRGGLFWLLATASRNPSVVDHVLKCLLLFVFTRKLGSIDLKGSTSPWTFQDVLILIELYIGLVHQVKCILGCFTIKFYPLSALWC